MRVLQFVNCNSVQFSSSAVNTALHYRVYLFRVSCPTLSAVGSHFTNLAFALCNRLFSVAYANISSIISLVIVFYFVTLDSN